MACKQQMNSKGLPTDWLTDIMKWNYGSQKSTLEEYGIYHRNRKTGTPDLLHFQITCLSNVKFSIRMNTGLS